MILKSLFVISILLLSSCTGEQPLSTQTGSGFAPASPATGAIGVNSVVPSTAPIPTVLLTSNTLQIPYLGTALLTWTSTYATSCSLIQVSTGQIVSNQPQGQTPTPPLVVGDSFVLTCSNGTTSSSSPPLTIQVIPPSGTIQAVTPPAPVNLVLMPTSPTAFLASWNSGGGSTAGYYVRAANGNVPNLACTSGQTDNGQQLFFPMTGLTPNSIYTFIVCAYDITKTVVSPVVGGTITTPAVTIPQSGSASYALVFGQPCPTGGTCTYTGAIEDNGVTLSCSTGFISVISAAYGVGLQSMSCTSFVATKCNTLSYCPWLTFSDFLCGGDPDSGITKGGTATITCVPPPPVPPILLTFGQTCPFGSVCSYSGAQESIPTSMACSGGHMTVFSASYAADSQIQGCYPYISSQCNSQSVCYPTYTNANCEGDPANGFVKSGGAIVGCN